MQKNNFCIILRKSLKLEETKNAPSHFLIYKNKEQKSNQINQKFKEILFKTFYKRKNQNKFSSQNKDDIILKNYILSQKILVKYNKNYGSMKINNIIMKKKCHFCAVYNDMYMYINEEIEYIKKYYAYDESIKIIPKRQIYFKHLMIYNEGPVYKNFSYNKLLKEKDLEKLNIYKRTNYPKKYNKKTKLSIDNLALLDSNIIFNSNVIESIENCSTSLTQCSNKNFYNINNIDNNKIIQSENCEKKNINETFISEIKNNGCINKRNENNNSCIDNSMLIVMKDLAISPNLINNYLYKHNNNYKNLYNRMKSKSKTITNNNRKNEKERINNKEDRKDIAQIEKEHTICQKESENNLIRKINQNGIKDAHKSNSLMKHINNIKIKQFNSNSIKSPSKILNSCANINKYGLSLVEKKQINPNSKKDNNKFPCKDNNSILFNYFNDSNKGKTDKKNINKYFKKNKIQFNINNKNILKSIKKIIANQRTKNNSLRKFINTQKLTDSTHCILDTNSLNENETKKMIQSINPVKSISISNNQFFKCIKKFGNDINNEK